MIGKAMKIGHIFAPHYFQLCSDPLLCGDQHREWTFSGESNGASEKTWITIGKMAFS